MRFRNADESPDSAAGLGGVGFLQVHATGLRNVPVGSLVFIETRGRGDARNSEDVPEPSNTDDCGCMHLTHWCSLRGISVWNSSNRVLAQGLMKMPQLFTIQWYS